MWSDEECPWPPPGSHVFISSYNDQTYPPVFGSSFDVIRHHQLVRVSACLMIDWRVDFKIAVSFSGSVSFTSAIATWGMPLIYPSAVTSSCFALAVHFISLATMAEICFHAGSYWFFFVPFEFAF